MTKKKFIPVFVMLCVFIINSCTGREENINENKNENVANKINLVSNKINNTASNRVNVIIFSVNIGRASQGCLRGWGFCNFQWFPLVNPDGTNNENSEGKLLVEAKKANNDTQYFEIHAGSEVPSNVTSEESDLIVDQDMTTQIADGSSIIIRKGTYHFDYSLGNFGGYKIPLY